MTIGRDGAVLCQYVQRLCPLSYRNTYQSVGRGVQQTDTPRTRFYLVVVDGRVFSQPPSSSWCSNRNIVLQNPTGWPQHTQ